MLAVRCYYIENEIIFGSLVFLLYLCQELKRKSMRLSEKITNRILLVLIIIVFIVAMIPMVYWWNHPELTKMEIFKEYWELYTGIFILTFAGQFWIYKN